MNVASTGGGGSQGTGIAVRESLGKSLLVRKSKSGKRPIQASPKGVARQSGRAQAWDAGAGEGLAVPSCPRSLGPSTARAVAVARTIRAVVRFSVGLKGYAARCKRGSPSDLLPDQSVSPLLDSGQHCPVERHREGRRGALQGAGSSTDGGQGHPGTEGRSSGPRGPMSAATYTAAPGASDSSLPFLQGGSQEPMRRTQAPCRPCGPPRPSSPHP